MLCIREVGKVSLRLLSDHGFRREGLSVTTEPMEATVLHKTYFRARETGGVRDGAKRGEQLAVQQFLIYPVAGPASI
jgi:hypothetical protein